MSFMIVLAVGGAFATTDPPCVYEPQFYKLGLSFQPTGDLGVHYVCVLCPFACTYYRPDPVLMPNYYAPCREGLYLPILI